MGRIDVELRKYCKHTMIHYEPIILIACMLCGNCTYCQG